MSDTFETLQAAIDRLEQENWLLRKTIEIQKRQIMAGGWGEEISRLRAKIAEWEGSSRFLNGGYYHGNRFITPYRDRHDQ